MPGAKVRARIGAIEDVKVYLEFEPHTLEPGWRFIGWVDDGSLVIIRWTGHGWIGEHVESEEQYKQRVMRER